MENSLDLLSSLIEETTWKEKHSSMFTSNTDLWSTPQELFDKLNAEFHFTIDVCAIPENAKCNAYYTKDDDGLKQPWDGVVWCNPPYGRQISQWVRRAWLSSAAGNTVVMLIPARTDTKWFHEYIYQKSRVEIRFIKGRLKFGCSTQNAPFPSMICVFRPTKSLQNPAECGTIRE